ncbi:isochorismatase family protein [Corynebacterium hindlerae]|uniref:isochorismatase family protein n=1 Tax=Corynebacterium hindlerae TaxID=699041 RepID=UPI0031B7136A
MAIPRIPAYRIPELPETSTTHWHPNPQRAALLVHDMQEYFLAAYDHAAEPVSRVVENISALIRAAEQHKIPVYFSVQPPQQKRDRRGLLSEFWGPGLQTEADARVVDKLPLDTNNPLHHVVTKWRYSAFERTDLRHALAYAGRDQLLITGVYGHIGCKVTATDAFMSDIQPFLINDAIADFSAADHAQTTDWVARRCGMVSNTHEILSQLEAVVVSR